MSNGWVWTIVGVLGVLSLFAGIVEFQRQRRKDLLVNDELKKRGLIASSKTYRVTCPLCSADLVSPSGKRVKCPKCGGRFKVTPNA